MARRNHRNEDSGIALLIIFLLGTIGTVLSALGNFINNYGIYILIILIIVVIYYVVKTVLAVIKKNKIIQLYKKSPYYLENKIAYKTIPVNRGITFEIEIYNRLKYEFKENVQIIHSILIPKVNAVNEYAEIDLIVIHTSGIYVVEAKNFSGPVSGKDDEMYWRPYLEVRNENNELFFKQNFAIKGFSKFGLYNPIWQNESHIQSLNSLFQNYYSNIVIFSNTMLLGHSRHPKIHSLNDFVDLIKLNNSQKYLTQELIDLKKKIISLKVTDPKAIKLHLARFN